MESVRCKAAGESGRAMLMLKSPVMMMELK